MNFKPLDKTKSRRRLFLMRHGEVDYLNPDGSCVIDSRSVLLTPNGVSQAQKMSSVLKDITFDKVMCSGLPRTLRTAELASQIPVDEIEIHPGFTEILEGNANAVPEDLRLKELVYYMETAGEPDALFAGGDSFSEFGDRIISSFENIASTLDWGKMLLVSHGIVNSFLLAYLVTGSKQAALSSMARFEQDPCCLNVIDLDMDGDKISRSYLRTINMTPYDLPKSTTTLISDESIYFDWLGPYDK